MKENLVSAWITWEKQIRNRSLSKKFNAEFYEFDYNGSKVSRYIRCICKTLIVLFKRRNGVIFVQNPSIVLALLAISLKPFLRFLLIIDAHNSALFPNQKWLQYLSKIVIKKSDFTIVTNQNLAELITKCGGHALILPDPLPTFAHIEYLRGLPIETKKVFFICSWADDEPYLEVFRAAEYLHEYTFYVSGKSKGKELRYGKTLPSNVILTGYLPDDDYHAMLATSAVILDLTTREDCLVCGAYEATSLERPFVVSDKKALRAYFKSGCLYVKNTAEDIANGVELMNAQHQELKKQIELSRIVMEKNWNLLYESAEALIVKQLSF